MCGWCEWKGAMALLVTLRLTMFSKTKAVPFSKLIVIPAFFIESWEISKGISLACGKVHFMAIQDYRYCGRFCCLDILTISKAVHIVTVTPCYR